MAGEHIRRVQVLYGGLAMTTAKEAIEITNELMEKWPKRLIAEYIGHWNTLALYLEAKAREEKAAHGTETSAEA